MTCQNTRQQMVCTEQRAENPSKREAPRPITALERISSYGASGTLLSVVTAAAIPIVGDARAEFPRLA